MTSEETVYCNAIDTLIRQGRNFAIWRIPGESPRFVMQSSGSARLFYNIKELDEQKGFVVVPFHATSELPIVLIEPDIFDIPKPENAYSSNEPKANEEATPTTENAESNYLHCFDLFIRPLREKRVDKLVLSRHLTLDRPHSFSPAAAFYQASRRYTRSYVYLCHTPQTGTWLGSTPEIILSGQNGAWNTVALAGTQPLINNELPSHWNDKNREEQAIVANYIRSQLGTLGITPVETAPYTVRAGELSHLKSNFSFSLPDNKSLGDLLKRLHPTPAVCGLPKEEAYRFILRNEGYNRRYYSGFIGWLDPEKRSDLYVNLRCMQIAPHSLTLYAGGGLLPSSQPDEEWQETEAKMQTMKRLIDPYC